MPELPFSLFDFSRIDKIEPFHKHFETAAGGAIAPQNLFVVPEHKIVLILGVNVLVEKSTGTALTCSVVRNLGGGEDLILETADSGPYSWPSGKATAKHVIGWHLLWMFPGEAIAISHALTAAEVITHDWIVSRIQYRDPRFEK